jgi:hypothetical protein
MNYEIINLTPHEIIVESGIYAGVYPASGQLARIEEKLSTGGDGTEIVTYSSKITGLPDPRPGTVYVVSTMTAMAAVPTNRTDIMAPYGVTRDADGRIVGTKQLVRVALDRELVEICLHDEIIDAIEDVIEIWQYSYEEIICEWDGFIGLIEDHTEISIGNTSKVADAIRDYVSRNHNL